jgi:hypothetical protein
MASQLLQFQAIQYYQYLSRSLNAIGQDITVYATAQEIRGSWQPVPRKLYFTYGLDLQKDYFTFYAPYDVLDVTRNVSGDQLVFKGKRFQVESNNDWFQIDGWKGILCVDLGADNG